MTCQHNAVVFEHDLEGGLVRPVTCVECGSELPDFPFGCPPPPPKAEPVDPNGYIFRAGDYTKPTE